MARINFEGVQSLCEFTRTTRPFKKTQVRIHNIMRKRNNVQSFKTRYHYYEFALNLDARVLRLNPLPGDDRTIYSI